MNVFPPLVECATTTLFPPNEFAGLLPVRMKMSPWPSTAMFGSKAGPGYHDSRSVERSALVLGDRAKATPDSVNHAMSMTPFESTAAEGKLPAPRLTGVTAVSVMVALADFVVSARDVVVSVTVGGLGNAPGAVNVIGVPDALVAADRLPHEAPPHSEPASDQVTPLFEGSPVTVAVMVVVALTATVAVVGAIDTEIPAGVVEPIVIVADADFVPSVTDVAVSVTVAGLGAAAGAV